MCAKMGRRVRSRPGRVNRGLGVCVRKILRGSSTRLIPLRCRLRSSRRRLYSEQRSVDPIGMIYVLHEEEAEVRKNPKKQLPLVIRGNVYDCVDIIFKNEIPDDARTGWANKINLHPHFFQFDTSASDGPTIGFSYDMSLRAFTMLKDPEPTRGCRCRETRY